MKLLALGKRKVLNDPVHGFISIPYNIIFEVIEHPFFQRLRRIKQLGLTDYVYPGALHTRFHHALGAFHLMRKAIATLRAKDIKISDKEEEAALLAILLHDIGHGPYSHTLEHCLTSGVSHEQLSTFYMHQLNKEFKGKLDLAIEIFEGKYKKKFLHQLVSSQLDVDRLDYLTRDSFFTGVSEGVVNHDRILDMIHVKDDAIVVEAKGIYSIEKFLVSRRLMYWQVYLHKTVVCAEEMLVRIFLRAKSLVKEGVEVQASKALSHFLKNEIGYADFLNDPQNLQLFSKLDDHDMFCAVKNWVDHKDKVLSFLCASLVDRKLFKIRIHDKPLNKKELSTTRESVAQRFGISAQEAEYLVFSNKMTNYLYNPGQATINILNKDGSVVDLAEASDQWIGASMVHPVSKYYLCEPKVAVD